ncbi:UNVERIFIED_CONTAM: hypothetical protein FKN15_004603 [Acipenser sinensis]
MEDASSAPPTPVCTGETDIDTENENEAVEVAEEQPSTSGVQEHDDPNRIEKDPRELQVNGLAVLQVSQGITCVHKLTLDTGNPLHYHSTMLVFCVFSFVSCPFSLPMKNATFFSGC